MVININPENSGTVERNPDLSHYSEDTIVELTAVPFERFILWDGDYSAFSNPILIRMETDKIITAYFETIEPTEEPSPVPTETPGGPTETPVPTETPDPDLTPEPTAAPTQIPTPEPKTGYIPFYFPVNDRFQLYKMSLTDSFLILNY